MHNFGKTMYFLAQNMTFILFLLRKKVSMTKSEILRLLERFYTVILPILALNCSRTVTVLIRPYPTVSNRI
jgi:hypothetical protein